MTHCNLDMTKYGKGMQRECILYIDSRDHDGSWHIPGMRPETCTRFSGLVMGEGHSSPGCSASCKRVAPADPEGINLLGV